MAIARGSYRRPIVQNNNAPIGYGQNSPYLDRAQPMRQQQEQQPYEPYARTQPVGRGVQLPEGSGEPAPHMQALDELEKEERENELRNQLRMLADSRAKEQATKGGEESGSYQGDPRTSYDSGDYAEERRGPMPGSYTITGSSQGGVDGAPEDWNNRKLTMDDILGGIEGGYVDGPVEKAATVHKAATLAPSARDIGARSGQEMVGSWGDTSGLRGFNTNEWGQNSPEYDEASEKNDFGKIATKYPHTPDGLRALVQDEEFLYQFPGATLVDHPTDPKIDFGDGRPVDVLFQSDQGWQWLTADMAGGGGGGAAQGGGAGLNGRQATGAPGAPGAPSTFDDPRLAALGQQLGLDGNQIQQLLQQLLLEDEEQQAMLNQAGNYLPSGYTDQPLF